MKESEIKERERKERESILKGERAERLSATIEESETGNLGVGGGVSRTEETANEGGAGSGPTAPIRHDYHEEATTEGERKAEGQPRAAQSPIHRQLGLGP